MARITVRRVPTALRPAARPPFPGGAIVLGLGLGAALGFVLGELLGPAPWRPLVRSAPSVTGASVRGLVSVAQAALEDDLLLRDCHLEVIPVGPGRIELHGWVGDRRARARAARLVSAAVDAEAIINGLRVRGEDDQPDLLDPSGPDELLA